MKKFCWLFVLIMNGFLVNSQEIFISSSGNELHRLNLETCKTDFVVKVNKQIFDISFHPSGKLYGISGNGNFFEIDTVMGSVIQLYDFNGQIFNSLTINSDGLVFTTGVDGELWSYDILNNIVDFIGSFGYAATGDLTFYQGGLYVAVTGDRIVNIDLINPQNSKVVIDENIPGSILGIVSFSENCSNTNTYAMTDGNSNLYKIDFNSNTLDLVCNLGFEVFGGASSFEFYGSSPILVDNIISTIPKCNFNNGSIEIIVSGGTGNIFYSLDSVNFQSDGKFFNLSSGDYRVFLRDDIGCTNSIYIDLKANEGPNIRRLIARNPKCGLSNGSIDVDVSGGIGNILYSINGGILQSNNIFENLSFGKYIINIVDDNACNDIDSIDLFSEDSPQIIDIIIDSTKCGNNSGVIIVEAIGGKGNLKYSIDGIKFHLHNIFENLSTNNYLIFVKDENGCIDSIDVELWVNEHPKITNITSMPVECNLNNGQLLIYAEGGRGKLEFSIDGINYQLSNNFENLSIGNYTVYLKDDNNCVDSLNIEISGKGSPRLSLSNVFDAKCNKNNGIIDVFSEGGSPPYKYSKDGNAFQESNVFINLEPTIYSIFIQDIEGCRDTLIVEVGQLIPPKIDSVLVRHTSCGQNNGSVSFSASGGQGFKYSIDTSFFQNQNYFQDLAPKKYIGFVIDDNLCLDSLTFTIEPSDLPLARAIDIIHTTCGADNGHIYIENINDQTEYSINNNDYVKDNIFTDLMAGNYFIYIKDENDCIIVSNAHIETSKKLYISNLFISSSECGEGNGRVGFEIGNALGLSEIKLNNEVKYSGQIFENLQKGLYDVLITDQRACVFDTIIYIGQLDCPIYIPNIFSPNDDGYNDIFKLFPHKDFIGSNISIRLFDRWGSLISEKNNIDPFNYEWNGTVNGEILNNGVYVYVIEYITENNFKEVITGDLTIVK